MMPWLTKLTTLLVKEIFSLAIQAIELTKDKWEEKEAEIEADDIYIRDDNKVYRNIPASLLNDMKMTN